jgi:Flp pilus assembly protein TadD
MLKARRVFIGGVVLGVAVACVWALVGLLRPEPIGDRLVVLATAAYEEGRWGDAAVLLEEALSSGVERYAAPDIWTALGNARANQGDIAGAIRAHRQALLLDTDSHKAWTNLGVVYRRRGDLVSAERCYRRALKLNPWYGEAYASLGALLLYRGETAAALPALQRAVRLAPALPAGHASLALAYALSGRFGLAERELVAAEGLGYPGAGKIREKVETLRARARKEEAP